MPPAINQWLRKWDAGALEDKEVVVDKNLITSRQPSDLPAFLRETIKLLKKKIGQYLQKRYLRCPVI
jgi:putative intracellular protease/amidase